jgi:hypothetical protein
MILSIVEKLMSNSKCSLRTVFIAINVQLLVPICHAEVEHLTTAKTDLIIQSQCNTKSINLETQFEAAPRNIKVWEDRKIALIPFYQFWFDKGFINPDPSKLLAPNTPINTERSVLNLTFRFPSLRGDKDPSYVQDFSAFFEKV